MDPGRTLRDVVRQETGPSIQMRLIIAVFDCIDIRHAGRRLDLKPGPRVPL